MAKRRMNIGNICKSKDENKSDYFQVRKDLKEPVTLKAGQFLSIESKSFQLASLDSAVNAGRLSPENGEKARERINKIADWVRAEVILVIED